MSARPLVWSKATQRRAEAMLPKPLRRRSEIARFLKGRKHLGCAPDAHLGAVLFEHPVSYPVALVLDIPVLTEVSSEGLWTCLAGC
jgi:hypothetical protein